MLDLNRNELETMRILWEGGPLKPAEIQERFGWPIENATLRSALQALVRKRHAKRRKQGKAYYYRAVARKHNALTRFARRMAEVFAGGSAGGLIMQLVRKERLSPEEIAELKRIAETKARTTDGGRRGDRP